MMMKNAILALLLMLAAGCDDESIPLEAVPLDKLPAGSLDAAKKKLPDVTFDRARKSKFNGQDAFEIIGKDKRGKPIEVEVSTSGEILEVE